MLFSNPFSPDIKGDSGRNDWLEERYGADNLRLRDDWRDWLHNSHVAHGPVGPEELDDLAAETIRTRGQGACDLVAADILATLGERVEALISRGEWGTRVVLESQETSGSGFGSIGEEELAVEVADAVQEEVMDDRRMSPQCQRHGAGLHLDLVGGPGILGVPGRRPHRCANWAPWPVAYQEGGTAATGPADWPVGGISDASPAVRQNSYGPLA